MNILLESTKAYDKWNELLEKRQNPYATVHYPPGPQQKPKLLLFPVTSVIPTLQLQLQWDFGLCKTEAKLTDHAHLSISTP